MRIGILTFHRPVNYGAYLQAFSLSSKLASLFPNDTVEIIDYVPPLENRKIYLNILRAFKRHGITEGIRSWEKTNTFKKAQNLLPLSEKKMVTGDLNSLYKYISQKYDRLVIGSDAVFNWNQTGFPTAFIPNYDFGIPVVSYAASVHGLKYREISSAQKEYCKKAFCNMKIVGTRDSATEEFVNYCSPDSKPIHCCDPTVFIDVDTVHQHAADYRQRILKKYSIDLTEPYIVFMAPESELLHRIYDKYSEEYKIYSVFVNSGINDGFMYDLNPFEWACVLGDASTVITRYFHGTLLSLVQDTPTVVLDYSGFNEGYVPKYLDLLRNRFGLPEFYYKKSFANDFDGSKEFFDQFDNMLSGGFRETIHNAVLKERKSMDFFMEMFKSL